MPNFSGIWTVTQQMQARGASTWPATPGAPTIGTASVASATSASVTFTAPACTGYPAGGITGYRVISTPGCVSNTGASSPIVVSGLTTGTAYTFQAQAQNANGYGALSAASNSVTPAVVGQQAYTSPGSYSWVAPTGVTSVSIVAIGGGAGGGNLAVCGSAQSGAGGGLGYKNNRSVTPGSSYTVVVGAGRPANCGSNAGDSYFCSTSVVKGGGGQRTGSGGVANGGGSYTGDGGAYGGYEAGGGGAAGGYGGAYTHNPCGTTNRGGNGNCGAGGGGARSYQIIGSAEYYGAGSGGGGTGILGQGSNGAGGVGSTTNYNTTATGGGGGSGGASGSSGSWSGGAGAGGNYGGGGGSGRYAFCCGLFCMGNGAAGAGGAVRIIWPGTTRSFPSTNTGNL